MANISITPVGASLVMPASIIGPMSEAKPPNRAKTMGTMIRAMSAERRLLMIRYMKATTMAKPRKVNIEILRALRDVGTDETRQSAQDERRMESGSKRGVQQRTSKHQNHRIVVVD